MRFIGRLFCTFVFLRSFMPVCRPAQAAPKHDNSVTSYVRFVITQPAKNFSLPPHPARLLSLVTSFQHLSPERVLTFTVFSWVPFGVFFGLLFFFLSPSQTRLTVYQRKHLHSEGWPPHCDRLIQVEWTSLILRALIIMKALRTQWELTSDRPFSASSALSYCQAQSVPSLNYILFTNIKAWLQMKP